MVLYRNQNQNLTEIENRYILFLCDRFRKTNLGIDLIYKCFSTVDTKHKIIFNIFFIYFLFHHLSFRKTKRGLFKLTLKKKFKLFIILIQKMVSLMVILFSTKCFLFVYMNITLHLLRLKVMLTYPGFFFKEANLS